MQSGVSIVIPVFNSATTIGEVVRRVTAVCKNLNLNHELILVNDGSQDMTWTVIQGLTETYSTVRAVNFSRNFGQHNALLCGIRMAFFEIVITMDDDLQHPPEEIPKLLEAMASGYDVVYGVPVHAAHSPVRNFLSVTVKSLAARAMGINSIANISAFRAFKTDLRAAFANYQNSSVLLDALLSWGTTRFGSVSTQHNPRQVGKSNYNFAKLFNQAILVFTGFSTAPLRLATLVGFLFTIVGVIILTYVFGTYFLFGSLKGFPFLASTIALFGGVQLFALGTLGEYVAKIFSRSLEKPTYVVKEVTRTARHHDEEMLELSVK